jgi:hypothetical protein
MITRSKSTIPLLAVVITLLTIGLSEHPQAYIDSGSGSYMLQLGISGLLGGIFAARSLWSKVRMTLMRRPSEKSISR